MHLSGLDQAVPVEAYVPVMLFALLFGLSMDYEVLLLTAVRECWDRTEDNRHSVRGGLAQTGLVIRGLLVPATMALLGNVNWWTPGLPKAEPKLVAASAGE